MPRTKRSKGLTMKQLVEQLHVGPRGVHGWIKAGVLPRPKRGRGARYDDEFVARARWIDRRRMDGWLLSSIKEELDETPRETILAAAGGGGTTPAQTPVVTERWERIVLLPGLDLLFRADGPPLLRQMAEMIARTYRG